MLKIVITPDREIWDNAAQEFVYPNITKSVELLLEHSLISISKWESKWHKSFLETEKKTNDELVDYICCMIVNNVPNAKYLCRFLTKKELKMIFDYQNDSMTATHFINNPTEKDARKHTGDKVTSELIYYWMVNYRIPSEYEKWHLSRLLTLIKICMLKSEKPKKMSPRSTMQQNAALNAARRAKSGSKG